MTDNEQYLILYCVIAVLILSVLGVIVALSLRVLKSSKEDFDRIISYALSVNLQVLDISRVSNLVRILNGGFFSISNVSRIYKVDTSDKFLARKIFYIAFDELSGETKIGRGKLWVNI